MKVVNTEKLIKVIQTKNFPKKGELHRIIEQMSFEIPVGVIPELKDNSQIDMTNVFYPEPTQVWYLDSYMTKRCGLAFHEYLIDLTTGRALTCQEILRRAQNMGINLDDAIIEKTWSEKIF